MASTSSSSNQNNSQEFRTLNGSMETENRDFNRWLRNHIYIGLLESTEKMGRNMEMYKKKQEECDRNLESLKSNLNELRDVIFDTSSASYSQHAKVSKEVISVLSERASGQRKKEKLDVETAKNLIRFLMNEIEEGAFKLETNMTMAKESQLLNVQHLKNIEKSIQETETELGKEEKRKILKSNVPASCQKCKDKEDSRARTQAEDKGINTESLPEDTSSPQRESRRELFQRDDVSTPSKRPKLEGSIPTSRERLGKRERSEKSPDTDKRASTSKEGETGAGFMEGDTVGPERALETHLHDAETHIAELRRQVTYFEELLSENRRILNALTGSLDSAWVANQEDKRNREIEKIDREFVQNLASQMTWSEVPSSQPGPSTSENNQSTPLRNLFAFESTLSGTPTKYLDTQSAIAQEAIRNTIGPLNAEQLTAFLDDVRKKQNYIQCVRRYTTDFASLLQQLNTVKSNLEYKYKQFLNEGGRALDFDKRLLFRLETVIKNIERLF